MSSIWHRVAAISLVGAFALCSDAAVAEERDQEGHEFIPSLDEACGASCPDPDAPLSRVNVPPMDENFEGMFVATESGLKIVRNPHWNGTEATGAWCGIHCQDPYQPAGLTNQFRRNDAEPHWLRFVPCGDDVCLGVKRNPHWVWRAANETIKNSTLYPPLPLSGLRASSTETDLGAEESGSDVVSRSVDRTGVAYHAAGNDVFQPAVLQTIGGVLSQGSVAVDGDGRAPKVELALGLDGTYRGHVLVSDGAATGRYRIRYGDLVPMALFVDGGGTSLYTLWSADRLPANFQREAGFAQYVDGPGFVAIEFVATRFADALYFLDTCAGCVAFPDDDSESALDTRSASDAEAGSGRRSSYINSDVGSPFKLEETSVGAIEVTGPIVRFRWSADAGTGRRVSVDRKDPIVRPDELRANVDRWIAEKDGAYILRLMVGVDVRKEGSMSGRRKLADAVFLFETLALLRASKLHWPEDWTVLMAVLSSEWSVRKDRAPWERYTETFCGVYPARVECAHRGER